MKHNYEAVYYDGEPNERLPEWRVVKWEVVNGSTKLGRKVFAASSQFAIESYVEELNRNPIWIIVDNGDTFEGHQGHWANCFFSNSYESAIRNTLDVDELFPGCGKHTYEIREMTDEELEKFPEALQFRENLLKQYGEF
jgi:hypothetical protein